jgi:hypothetical protein
LAGREKVNCGSDIKIAISEDYGFRLAGFDQIVYSYKDEILGPLSGPRHRSIPGLKLGLYESILKVKAGQGKNLGGRLADEIYTE